MVLCVCGTDQTSYALMQVTEPLWISVCQLQKFVNSENLSNFRICEIYCWESCGVHFQHVYS